MLIAVQKLASFRPTDRQRFEDARKNYIKNLENFQTQSPYAIAVTWERCLF
jgi:hypothetical protein